MAKYRYDKQTRQYFVTHGAGRGRIREKYSCADAAKHRVASLNYEAECKKAAKTYIEPTPFPTAVDLYRAEQDPQFEDSTVRSDKYRLNVLLKHFSDKALDDITKTDIIRFENEMRSCGKADKTILNYRAKLSTLFEWGMKTTPTRCDSNPTLLVKGIKPAPKRERRSYTQSEIELLLTHGCGCCVPYYEILLKTGVRVGELFQLKKENFRFDEGFLFVPWTSTFRTKGKRGREIPLDPSLRPVVAKLPSHGKLVSIGRRKFDTHFFSFKALWQFELTLHELRHTCITNWLNMGAPIHLVQQWAGHKDIATTQKYVHATKEMTKQWMTKSGIYGESAQSNVSTENHSCTELKTVPGTNKALTAQAVHVIDHIMEFRSDVGGSSPPSRTKLVNKIKHLVRDNDISWQDLSVLLQENPKVAELLEEKIREEENSEGVVNGESEGAGVLPRTPQQGKL